LIVKPGHFVHSPLERRNFTIIVYEFHSKQLNFIEKERIIQKKKVLHYKGVTVRIVGQTAKIPVRIKQTGHCQILKLVGQMTNPANARARFSLPTLLAKRLCYHCPWLGPLETATHCSWKLPAGHAPNSLKSQANVSLSHLSHATTGPSCINTSAAVVESNTLERSSLTIYLMP
jgi:hypothetical protein